MVYLDDNIAHFDFEAAWPLLSRQRQEQALQFRFEQERKQCAMAYFLLCKGLREEYGLTEPPLFVYGETGKPYLPDHADIHFNISHCREAVVCVLSDRPVGVDIECVCEYDASLLDCTMSEAEKEEIVHSPHPDLAFIRLWTRKEAVLKCSGRGLIDDMRHVLDERPAELVTKTGPEGRYVYSICYGNQDVAFLK